MVKLNTPLFDEYIGKKVKVIAKSHPHFGATGVIQRASIVSTLNQAGFVIKRDDTDEEFYIFDGKDVKFI